MQITVKILQGDECQVEVSENTTVSMLKTLVESKLNVPRAQQKLVFRGKTLQDGDTVTGARLTDGAKVFLVTAKPAAAAAPPPPPPPPPAVDAWAPLRTLAENHLGKSDADRFMVEFKKKFELHLGSMSMDDIQRFCASNMTEF